MEEIIQEDKEVFLYLNNLGDTSFDQFWLLNLQYMDLGSAIYYILLFLI